MNNNASAGWKGYDCPFFTPVCRRVLSGYCQAQGFLEDELTPTAGIVYRRQNVFLETSYDSETGLNFAPTLIIGAGVGKYGEDGRPSAVPFWYLIPANLPERGYTFWKFKTEAELESVLVRVRHALLEPFAAPLLHNFDLLEKHIANFGAES